MTYKSNIVDIVKVKNGKDAENFYLDFSNNIILKFYETDKNTNKQKISFSPPKFTFQCFNKSDGIASIIENRNSYSLKLYVSLATSNIWYEIPEETSDMKTFFYYENDATLLQNRWNFDIEDFCNYSSENTYVADLLNESGLSDTITHSELVNMMIESDILFKIEISSASNSNKKTNFIVQMRFGFSSEMAQLQVNASNINMFVNNVGVTIDGTGLTLQNGMFQIVNEDGDILLGADQSGNLSITGILSANSIFAGTLQSSKGTFIDLVAHGSLRVGNIIIESDENGKNGRIYDSPNQNFLIKDDGSIIANNITLGTDAIIGNFIKIGQGYIYNSDKYEENGVEENLFIKANELKLYDNGRIILGDITLDSNLSTINCITSGGLQWTLNPDESIFNNVFIRGYLKQSVFTKQATNIAGGITIFKTGARIESLSGSIITLKISSQENKEEVYNYFSTDDIVMLSNENNDVYYAKITSVSTDSITIENITSPSNSSIGPDLITNLGKVSDSGDGQDWIIGVNATNSSASLGLNGNAISFNSFKIEDGQITFNQEISLGKLSDGTNGLYAETAYLKGSLTTKYIDNIEDRYSGINTLSPVYFNKQFSSYIVKSDLEISPIENVEYFIFTDNGFESVGTLTSFDPNLTYYKYERDTSPIIFWAGANNENDISNAPFQVSSKGTLYAQQGYFRGTIITEADIQASVIHTAHIIGEGDSAALKIEDADNLISFTDSNDPSQEIISLKKDENNDWVMVVNAKFQLGDTESTGNLSGEKAQFKILEVGPEDLYNTVLHLEGNKINFIKRENSLDTNLFSIQNINTNLYFINSFQNKTVLSIESALISLGEDFSLDENRLIYGRDKMYEEPVFDSFGNLIGYDLYIE